MKNFIKLVSLTLAIALIFVVAAPAAIAADSGKLVISGASAEGKLGKEVTVSLNVESNPGVVGLTLTIQTPEGITLKSAKNGTILDALTTGKNLVFDAASNSTATGTLVELTFLISGNATLGANTINVIAQECTSSNGKVDVEVEPIVINVLENEALVVRAEATEGKIGDEVQVSIIAESNPGFFEFGIKIPKVDGLSFVSAENGDVAEELTSNRIGTNFTWGNSTDTTATGLLGVITYKITEDAELGEITLEVESLGCYNEAADEVPVDVEALVVNVIKDKTPLTLVGTSTQGEIGDEIQVTLTLENNPGFAGLKMTIPEIPGLEFVSAENGVIVDNLTDSEDGFTFLWDSAVESTKTGVLGIFTYRITNKAQSNELKLQPTIIECFDIEQLPVELNPVGEIVITVLGELHTHSFANEVDKVEATCTEDGYVIKACSCGLKEKTTIKASGHKVGVAVKEKEAAADCVNAGGYDSVVYCNVCKAELSRENVKIDALGHTNGAPVEENRVEATETEDGKYDKVVYCTVCNIEISRETIVIPAIGSEETTTEEEVTTTEEEITTTEEEVTTTEEEITTTEEEVTTTEEEITTTEEEVTTTEEEITTTEEEVTTTEEEITTTEEEVTTTEEEITTTEEEFTTTGEEIITTEGEEITTEKPADKKTGCGSVISTGIWAILLIPVAIFTLKRKED